MNFSNLLVLNLRLAVDLFTFTELHADAFVPLCEETVKTNFENLSYEAWLF
jgi:hypothetical protein